MSTLQMRERYEGGGRDQSRTEEQWETEAHDVNLPSATVPHQHPPEAMEQYKNIVVLGAAYGGPSRCPSMLAELF